MADKEPSVAGMVLLHTPGQPHIEFEVEGAPQRASYTWFRGEHCNYNPAAINMLREDAVANHILKGWLPEQPIIDLRTRIVAFGSCFARHIAEYLAKREFDIVTSKGRGHDSTYLVRFAEGMVNSFAIRQQFEWALENRAPPTELWHGQDATSLEYDESVRQATRTILEAGDVFIITLGLAEVWYDEPTGGVFWRAVPKEKYDAARHRFRVSTVAENKDNIKAIYQIIKRHRPEARVIFTLSPIPLVATFRPVSCITANWASKSILRAALDEAYREINDPERMFYWPSYEIVMDVFGERWADDRRHVKAAILEFIMIQFELSWCKQPQPPRSLLEAWINARCAAGTLPKNLPKLLASGDSEALAKMLDRFKRETGARDVELIKARRAELTGLSSA